MLTNTTKRLIEFRMGLIMKHAPCCAGFYFEPKENRFVLATTYRYWNWYSTYYTGIFLLAIIFLIIYDNTLQSTIPDVSELHDYEKAEQVMLITNAVFSWTCILFQLNWGHVEIVEREQICYLYNQMLQLDRILRNLFIDNPSLSSRQLTVSRMDKQLMKSLEQNTKLCVVVSLTIPGMVCLLYRHPADPLAFLSSHILEIDAKHLGIYTIPYLALYFFVIFLCSCMIISAILLILLNVFAIQIWCRKMTPVSQVWRAGKRHYITQDGAEYSEEKLVLFYRTLEVVIVAVANRITAKTKIAFQWTVLLILGSGTGFALIRYNDYFRNNLEGSTLALAVVYAMVFPLVLYAAKMECSLLDDMGTSCMAFKTSFIEMTSRKAVINKIARSFKPAVLQLSYPFFRANRSSFLEWSNTLMDNLVNLLVST